MRPRSKSLYVERKTEDADQFVVKEDSTGWKFEDDVKLIHLVWEQVPSKDNLPYDERISKLNWEKVFIPGHTQKEIQERFHFILNKCRTVRLLHEILEDVKKELLTTVELPKKTASPFFLFIEKNKNMLKQQTKNGGTFPRIASKIFRELPDQEREMYKKEAIEMRKEYNDIICKYNLDFKVKNQKERKNTPFTVYWEHRKHKNPDVKFNEARAQYSKLDKDHKLKWILKWLEVKRGQKLNLDQYKLAKANLSKEDMTIIADYEEKPKKMSAYANFVKDYIAMHRGDDIPYTELFKRISIEWKNLPSKDKVAYEELSQKMKQDYDKEYKQFIESLPEDRREYELEKTMMKSPKKRKSLKSENTNLNSDAECTEETNNDLSKVKRKRKKKTIKSSNESKSNDSDDVDDDDDDFEKPQKQQKQQKQEKKIRKKTKNNNMDIPMVRVEMTEQKDQTKKQTKMNANIKQETRNIKLEDQKMNTETCSPDKLKREENISSSSEDDSDDEREIVPIKKPKISKETTSRKKVKVVSESDANVNGTSKRTKQQPLEEIMKTLKKPPGSAYKYYVLNIYKGPMNKAKVAFKKLSKSRKNTICRKYNEITTKFLNDFKAYAQTLTPDERIELSEMYRKSEDDQISDLTDSEEESD